MRKQDIIVGGLLCWALTSSFLTAFLWLHRPSSSKSATQEPIQRIKIDFLINYGNTTLVWHNGTNILKGMSVYEGLLLIADKVNATKGTAGYFVQGINDVMSDEQHGWVFAVKDRKEEAWETSRKVDDWYYPQVSVDNVIMEKNDKIAFLYYNWVEYGYNSPPNPTIEKNVR